MTRDQAEPNELADLAAPYYTAARAAQLLGVTQDQLNSERAAGRVLGVNTTDGDFFYPTLQFATAAGRVIVKPGLVSFFRVLSERQPWTIAVHLKMRADELDGLTPEQWVDEGRALQKLLDYAHVINAEMGRP